MVAFSVCFLFLWSKNVLMKYFQALLNIHTTLVVFHSFFHTLCLLSKVLVKLFPSGDILTHMALRELKITLHPNAKISLFSNETTNTTSVWKYPRTEHTNQCKKWFWWGNNNHEKFAKEDTINKDFILLRIFFKTLNWVLTSFVMSDRYFTASTSQ